MGISSTTIANTALSRPRVIAFFGAPCSGKTSVVDVLKRRGTVNTLLPLVVNEEREKDGAAEYQLKPRTAILDDIRKGQLLGWETLSGNFYALPRSTATDILSGEPATYGLLAGPSLVYPLERELADRADFFKVCVTVPEAEYAPRMAIRATVRDKARGVQLSIDTQRWLLNSVGNFDFIAENLSGGPEATADKVERFLLDPVKTPVNREQMTSVLAGMHLYNILELLRWNRSLIDPTTIDTLERSFRDLYHRPLFDYIMEIYNGVPHLTAQCSDGNPNVIVDHTFLVTSAGVQLRMQPYEPVIASPKRFGRLGLASQDRARRLYERLIEIQSRMTEEEEHLFTMLHDIGKVDNVAKHENRGFELCGKFHLNEGWDFKGFDPELTRLAIMHSHILGSSMLPDYSVVGLADALARPESKAVLANADGSPNMHRIKALFDRLILFTCKDCSGYGDGFLRVLIAEGYIELCDRLTSLFERNPGSFDAAISELKSTGPSSNRDRMLRFVAIEDMYSDVNQRTFDYYWDQIITPARQKAVDEGKISKSDWESLMRDLHHITRFGYGFFGFCDFLEWIGSRNGSDHVEDFTNFGNLFKILSIVTKAASAFSSDPALTDDFEFRFVDSRHHEMTDYQGIGRAMDLLNAQLNLASTEIVKEGNKITVRPLTGNDSPRFELYDDRLEGRRAISLKISDITI